MKVGKIVARKIIFPSLLKMNIDNIIRNINNKGIINVVYHGVVQKDSSYFSPRHITKTQFEKHLQYYLKNFNVVSIPEAFYLSNNKSKQKRKILTITFDDGFQNNLHNALPLLERYKLHATFFISSICAKNMYVRSIIPEYYAALNYFYKDEIIYIENQKFKNFINLENGNTLSSFINSLLPEERDMVIYNIIDKYKLKEKLNTIPHEVWKLMTKSEIVQLSNSDFVEIGSHGHSHYDLAKTDFNVATNELALSKQILENTINKKVDILAYPYGSYNEQIKDKAEEIGYKYQLAVKYKYYNDKNDPRILNRFGISNTTTFESNMIRLNIAFNK